MITILYSYTVIEVFSNMLHSLYEDKRKNLYLILERLKQYN